MALTYPRDLPSIRKVIAPRFELERLDLLTREGSGRAAGALIGWPLWEMSLAWGPGMTEAEAEAWVAFVTSLRGATRQLYAYNPRRRYPLSRPTGVTGLVRTTGGGTLTSTGDAASWSVNAGRDVVTLTNMPVGYRLRPGDLVGWRWSSDTRFTACKCLEDVTAAAGTGNIVMTVEPPLHASVPAVGAGCTAYTSEVKVLARLDPTRTQIGDMGPNRVTPGQLVAVQDLTF